MIAILYKNDGDVIEILSNENNFGYYIPDGFGFETKNDVCIILVVNSFGFNFEKIHNSEDLEKVLEKYSEIHGDFNRVLFILNEIIVEDETGFIEFSKKIGKDCYYANFDMMDNKRKYKVFLPLSLYTQIDYLLSNDFLNARKFLYNMNRQYRNLIKPYKLAFYSNHVSPDRVDIFNILKATDNLKNSMWSFNDSLVYYSDKKHNLDIFFKENKGIIPYSFDNYSEKTINLKHTYFSQFLGYFEIITESYFFRDIKGIIDYCPITEKLVKPIVSCLPFIVIGPPKLKQTLEGIGMTFNSKLYGFYDITNDVSVMAAMGHVVEQSIKTKEELHKIYFENIEEYENNAIIFVDYFVKHKKNIFNFLQGNLEIEDIDTIKNTIKNEKWIPKQLI